MRINGRIIHCEVGLRANHMNETNGKAGAALEEPASRIKSLLLVPAKVVASFFFGRGRWDGEEAIVARCDRQRVSR